MKKLFFVAILCIGLWGCSDDDDHPGNESPVSGVEIPSSGTDHPVKPGETVTIKGKGFTSSGEIWLRAGTGSEDEVKAEIVSVSSSGISFVAPEVTGEKYIILKQDGREYTLGKMVFADHMQDGSIQKRLVRWLRDGRLFHEFTYNAEGRLELFKEAMDDIRRFEYDANGRLVSISWYQADTPEQIYRRESFNYTDATTLIMTEINYEDNDTKIVTLTLNNEGRLIKKEADNETEIFEYDTNGNPVKKQYWENGQMETELTYSYDTNPSYFSNQGVPAWYWTYNDGTGFDCYGGDNNMIRGNKNGSFMEAFRFDYDDDGYPVVKYEDEEGNGDFIKKFEFIYEEIN